MSTGTTENVVDQVKSFLGLWKTGLVEVIPEHIWIRGYPIQDLIGNLSFAEMTFLVFRGELPSEQEAKLLNAVLCTVSVPQPPVSPLQIVPRAIAAGNPSVIAGIIGACLSIGKYIGQAADEAGELVIKALDRMGKEGLSRDEVADKIVEECRSSGKRIPGIGHPIHKVMDPRAQRLWDFAYQIGLVGPHTLMYEAIYRATVRQRGKPVAMNCDPYAGTLLLDIGFPKLSLTPLLLLSMMPGLIALTIEEIDDNHPVKGLPASFWAYNGPPRRDVPPIIKDRHA